MVGTGHSFTAIAAPEATMLRPGGLTGIVAVDRDAMTVTARAGTPLKDLNAGLEQLGLSLHNMGDIAEQTLAGAISTGTHGTGGVAAGLAAQVVGLELVTGTGEVLRATRRRTPTSSRWPGSGSARSASSPRSRSGSSRCSCSRRTSSRCRGTRRSAPSTRWWPGSHHVDMYWFPHTDRMLTKRNDRLDADLSEAEPLSRWRGWLDDDFLANTVFGAAAPPPTWSPR